MSSDQPIRDYLECFEDAERYASLWKRIQQAFVDEYVTETIQIKKSGWNSWNPVARINWNKIKRYLGDTIYLDFIKVSSDILGYDVETKSEIGRAHV